MTIKSDHLSERQKTLYHRQIILPEVGESGQLRLLHSSVLIIGLGGLGSPALYYLCACGVGEIGLLDGDRVELSNLNRQILYGENDFGKEKTLSASQSAKRLRDDVRLNLHHFRIDKSNALEIISGYDFIIEATDNFESKFLINDTCAKLRKPFSYAGVSGTFGQTMTVVPGEGPCFRCVFGEISPFEAVRTADEMGILGTVPGILGLIQATEAIKYLLDCGKLLTGRLLTWDALSMVFREIKLPPEKRCDVCKQ